jgi:hypothetical protein
MNESLRPLTLAEILDRTAQLYRSRFLVFLGVSTIPAGTVFVFAVGAFAFTAWIGSNSRHGGSVGDVLVWIFLALLVLLLVPVGLGVSAWGGAAMSEASARTFLGDAITIRGAFKNTWKRGWRYAGLYTLQGLAVGGIPAVLFCGGVFALTALRVSGMAANDSSPLAGGLVFLMLVVLGGFAVWMLLRLCLAFPACVVEQTTATSALRRSVKLSEGTRGRIFVLYLLGLILNWALSWGITFVVLIVIALIPALQGQKHSHFVGMFALFSMYGSYFIAKAVTKPMYGIAETVFYFDQRIRKEGFDIEWMMQQAGMMAQPPSVPAVQAMPVPAAAMQHDAILEEKTPLQVQDDPRASEAGLAAASNEGNAGAMQ